MSENCGLLYALCRFLCLHFVAGCLFSESSRCLLLNFPCLLPHGLPAAAAIYGPLLLSAASCLLPHASKLAARNQT